MNKAAKKNRLKHVSAPVIFGNILRSIGQPLFRLLLISGYLLILLFSFLRKTVFFLGRFCFWLLKAGLKIIASFFKSLSFIGSLCLNLLKAFFRFARLISLKPVKIPSFKPSQKWLFSVFIGLILCLGGLVFYLLILVDLPRPQRLVTREQAVSTKIYDRHGELLYKIYRNQNRTLVKLEEIPISLIQATIAIEDAEFYSHPGLSVKAIVRAFFQNLNGEKLYGGSTITQQLVKNTLLSPERTLERKIKEALLALWVEKTYSKNEILQMYFNEVGYGGAAYGAEEAAQKYFAKSVRDLNLAEAALLAGLPASPTAYSPFGAYPQKAKERQITVLQRMVQEKFITSEQAEAAQRKELHFVSQKNGIQAPHFVMYLEELLTEKYGQQRVEEGGLLVRTSLDLNLQRMVQEIVTREVAQLQSLRVTNGAALVTNPRTGEILAMVGSRDYFDAANDGNVNVTLAERQPGSSIKPVMYSLALENGFTAATIIPDTPITYQIPGQPPYSPRNYDYQSHGLVPLRVALASSYNVPAVKVLSALGVNRMIERGRAMGITTWEDPSQYGLSLTLGGGEVKMIDLAVAYGTLPNQGVRINLNPVLEVKDYQGTVLKEADCLWSQANGCEEKEATPKTQVFSPQIAFLLTDILSDNSARTPAFGPNSILNIVQHPHVAVKTGTTQNLRDNWTVGFSPDFLVAVWVGNNDNTPMSQIASGITGASPIWNKIMTRLLENTPDKEFPNPGGLNYIEICPATGTLPCEGCGGKGEYFLPGTEPKNHCQSPKPEKTNESDSQTPTLPELSEAELL